MKGIRERFAAHVAKTGYEELCRRAVVSLSERGDLPFEAERVGRVWSRTAEIAVAASNPAGRCALLGECKWSHRKLGAEVLSDLRAKAAQFRRLRGYKVHFALFSRSGFERSLLARARDEGVMLFEGLTRRV
jgi:hypothetical protein